MPSPPSALRGLPPPQPLALLSFLPASFVFSLHLIPLQPPSHHYILPPPSELTTFLFLDFKKCLGKNLCVQVNKEAWLPEAVLPWSRCITLDKLLASALPWGLYGHLSFLICDGSKFLNF